jgi:uncharacterized damage-inducible protein DinB/ubiquinone/menaquinone biosynthesis C-methylase UbiE
MTPELCRTLAQYNRWMNDKLYAIAASLSDDDRKRDRAAFFKSIHGTLNHLLLGDRVWMGRFAGVDLPADVLGPGDIRSLDQELYADFDELRQERAKTDLAIIAWASSLRGSDLAAPLVYTRRGVRYEEPLWWSVAHLFNHQTHHRGQVTTLLMQAGNDPGVTDLIALLRETPPDETRRPAEQPSASPAKEAYDAWASVYDHDQNPLIALDEIVLPALLGPVRGLRIADLACGTGRHSKRVADAGARVTCVDFSPNMLQRCKERLLGLEASFVEHDLRSPLPFPDAAFDGVICSLALEHVKDLAAFFHEARRICSAGAFVICSDMHPAMRLRGKQACFDDPTTGETVRVEGYEHPVSEYVTAAQGAGFSIEAIQEHKGDAALLDRAPRMAKYVGWPMLVAMRLLRR